MSIFFTGNNHVPSMASVAAALKSGLAAKGTAGSSKELVNGLLTYESMEGMNDTQRDGAQTIAAIVEESGLREVVAARLVNLPCTDEVREKLINNALEAAATILATSADPVSYITAMQSATDNGRLRQSADNVECQIVGDINAGNVYTVESFDKDTVGEYITTAAIVSALNTGTSPASEVLFRTVPLPAGVPGIDIDIRNPVIFQKRARDTSGSKYDLKRVPLSDALVDPSILKNNALDLITYSEASKDAVLVKASAVAPRPESVNGVTFASRPIRFGKEVDLIALTGHPGIPDANSQDETDTLVRNLSLKQIYVGVHYNAAEHLVAKFPLTNARGSLFQRNQENNVNNAHLNMDAELVLRSDMVGEGGQTLDAAAPTLRADLGIASPGVFGIKVKVGLSGSVDFSRSNAVVHFIPTGTEVVSVFIVAADGTFVEKDLADPVVSAAIAKLEVNDKDSAGDVLGWDPKGSRTNSNMRTLSTVCEMGPLIRYRIPVRSGAPFVAIFPTHNEGDGATVDAMTANIKVLDQANVIDALIEFRDFIAMTGNAPSDSTCVGVEAGIKPTYIFKQMDVINQIVIQRSGNGMEDLRSVLTDAVTIVANNLLLNSNYLAVAANQTGSMTNYEVAVATDPHIANHLMYGGEGRTLGNDRKFTIAAGLNKALRNRIFITFRRSDTDKPSCLDFGVYATKPAMMYSATTTRTSSTTKEVHLIPFNRAAVLCPVLGEIEVQNLDKIFVG